MAVTSEKGKASIQRAIKRVADARNAGYTTTSKYIPRSTKDVSTDTAQDSTQITTPTVTKSQVIPTFESTTTPQTYEEVYKGMERSAQGEINALKEYEKTQLAEQAKINAQNERSTAAVSTLTGLAGSSEANVAQQKTTEAGQKANRAIQAEAELKVQTLLGGIRQSAVQEAQNQREEARLDEASRIANRAARQQEAVTQLTELSASGVTYEGLKQGDPE